MPIKPRPILPAPKCNAFIVLTFINVFTREGWGEGLHRFPLNLTLSTRGEDIAFIFRTADALALLAHPSHVLMYAPGDSLRCRLPAARTILGILNC
ncbi:hypothetical protein LFZ26_18395 [Salmonella enterica subsp. enterica serovar Manchester str. ST278]|nr:hypothetical protein LFZ26_18395 [Salmonella enterica subsp. enterica serovar Manchester str. ST278]